jgi:hypothetical protein
MRPVCPKLRLCSALSDSLRIDSGRPPAVQSIEKFMYHFRPPRIDLETI